MDPPVRNACMKGAHVPCMAARSAAVAPAEDASVQYQPQGTCLSGAARSLLIQQVSSGEQWFCLMACGCVEMAAAGMMGGSRPLAGISRALFLFWCVLLSEPGTERGSNGLVVFPSALPAL